jgi:hypothetical protein
MRSIFLVKSLKRKSLHIQSISTNDQSTAHDVGSPPNDAFSNARLKKKVVHTRTSKRQKAWFEAKSKGRKMVQSKTQLQGGASMLVWQNLTKVHSNMLQNISLTLFIFFSCKVQEVWEEASNNKGKEPKQYRVINSFTKLLCGANTGDLKIDGYF